MKQFKNTIWNTLLSIGISLLILGLIVRLVSRTDGNISSARLFDVFRNTPLIFIGFYGICQLLQTIIRAARYNVLLAGSGSKNVPPLFHTFLITATRNMLVDCFPARTGELSYIAMLNQGYKVSGEACVTSLTVSTLLDFAALLLLILIMAAGIAVTGSIPGWLITVIVLLSVILVVGSIALFLGVKWASMFIHRFTPGVARWKPAKLLLDFIDKTADSFSKIASVKTILIAFIMSCGVRFFKYAGIYLVFLGIASASFPELHGAPLWKVFSALISAEAGASMPIPTFMSFGAYESGGLLALTALGFPAADSVLVMFATHVYTQIMDYGLGGLCFILFLFFSPGAAKLTAAAPATNKPSRSRILLAGTAVLILMAGAGMFALQIRNFQKLGALKAPASGAEVEAEPAGFAGLREKTEDLNGFIVWSSNRSGKHEIYRKTLPDLTIERLTENEFTDTYPRISPDGKKVVFCRSQIGWVSQRDPIPWDIYIIDLDSGEERLVARHGNTPVWTDDGKSVCFQRNGNQFVRHFLETGEEEILFQSGKDNVPANCQLQTPSFNQRTGQMAVTLRGAKRMTAIAGPGNEFIHIGAGCQLTWSPNGEWLYYAMDRGGHMRNYFVKYNLAEKEGAAWLDLPGEYSHEYFPKMSNNSKHLVFGASAGGHEHDTADYEIFLWEIDTPPEEAARVTWHTANDCWPDIFLNP